MAPHPMSQKINVYDAFGDKIASNPINMKRSTRKSSRSPINPVELRNSNSARSSKHDHGDTCENHKGVSPRTPKRALDILNVPRSSRSPSPRGSRLERQASQMSPQRDYKSPRPVVSTPRSPWR